MSSLSEKIEQHTLHTLLRQILGIIEGGDLRNESLEIVDLISKIGDGIRFITESLVATPKNLININLLDNISSHLNNTLNAISQYASNKDVQQLHLASSFIDSAVEVTTKLPILKASQADSWLQSLDNFKKQTFSYLGQVSNKKTEIETQYKEISSSTTSLAARITEQESRLNQIASNIDSKLASEMEQFNQARSALSAEKVKYQEQLKTDHTKSLQEFEEKVSTTLLRLEEFDKQASNIVGLIGRKGLTGSYQKNADYHRWAAEILRVLAILAMGLAAYLLIYPSWHQIFDVANQIPWHEFLYRIPIALVLLVPAFYCARESEKHRNQELVLRQYQIQLSSLPLYLEQIKEAKDRESIVTKLTERFFSADAPQDKTSTVSLKELIKAFKDLITELGNKSEK